jgi:NAD-dependent deacetylase
MPDRTILQLQPGLAKVLEAWRTGRGRVVVLTGAGISAESGIPTFRGKDGYWTVGSTHYTPMQMATRAMFDEAPEQVWAWYLWRFSVCVKAEPNAGHRAIVSLEKSLGDRMALVTQNVDGLHQRAGSSSARTYAIHGDARKMRCAAECDGGIRELPNALHGQNEPSALKRGLTCDRCGGWLRPHVLWFDEFYEERLYRSESALAAARGASLLIVVGTSGATTLPMRIATECLRRGVPIIDVNIEPNVFSEMAESNGVKLTGPAASVLPELVHLLVADSG